MNSDLGNNPKRPTPARTRAPMLVGMNLLEKTVAVNSIMAMLLRTAIWIGIMMLIKSRSRGQEGNA